MAATEALPTSEQLDGFLDELRRADFKIGPDQIAGAQKILLLAHAETNGGLAARRLKTMLAPIIVRTATQQADFYRRFDDMMAGIAPAGMTQLEPAEYRGGDADTEPTHRTQSKRPLVLFAGTAAMILAVAGGLWLMWPQPPPIRAPTPPETGSPAASAGLSVPVKPVPFVTATLYRRAGYEWAQAGLISLPLLLFSGWMGWRWRRRMLWLDRHPGIGEADPALVRLPDNDQPLFPATELTTIAPDLRRHARVPSRDLDIDQTISATLEAGGSFTPVWQMVPRSPTYLFLIEKESTHDHVAGILDRAVDRLVDEKVAIERYHFRGDPRWLVGGETGRQLEPIADVAARYGDHRLVVLGAGDGMFEPLSDRLDAGVEQALTQWAPRAVLSTKPLETWSWRELSLVDQGGFDLATASHSGLRALAGRAAAESDRPAEMLEGVVVSMPARPSLGSREPQGAVSASDAGRRTVRVFISSPADVRAERLIAERVVQRLDEEFALHLELRAVMWEREPLLASHHVQGLITPPHDTDIVVVILWTRLGPALPADKFAGPLSDGEVSGTEWEFEDALKSYRERGAPEILVYRKTVEPTFAVGDTNAARERLGQKERLDAFLRKWFADPDSANPTAASSSFADAAQFEQMLEDHLRALVRRRARSEVPRQARKSALLICVGRELGGEADVERFAALLRDSAGFAVEVLRNPNRTTLTDALESLLRQNSDPDAIILIHFKGRYAPGGEGALFVGSDIIPASNFAGILNRSAAGHQLIIIDGFSHFQIEGDPVVGGLSEATSSLPRYTREAISSLATRETDRHLTGLLIEAFEHNLDRITAPDFTFRDLFELVRRRDALIDSGSVVSHPLNELNIRYFSNGSTSTVIGAAHPRATQTPLPPSLIFISYAREDQAAAGRLCDFLEESGLDVWLDSRQLSAGEDWSEESRRQIDNCSLFVPLISTNSLRRQDGLFHREWMQATERARGLDPSRPFIIPVAIDDTPADTEDIPEEFRSVQWTWLPGGAGDEAFLQRVVGLMSRTPADDGGKMSVVMKSVKKSKRPFMSSVADWLDQLTPWETRDVRIYITSPRSSRDDLQDKQSYGDMFSYKVEGRLRRLPEGHEIWLLNVNERSKEIWPQGFAPVTDWDAQTGEWTGRVCGRPVETIKIVAVVAPPTSADFFHYYQELCDQGTVKPLKRIPPECINRASVQATLR